jgi:hypothetical protein
MELSGQLHVPAALPPVRAPGSHWIGGCVGPRAVLNAVVLETKGCKYLEVAIYKSLLICQSRFEGSFRRNYDQKHGLKSKSLLINTQKNRNFLREE